MADTEKTASPNKPNLYKPNDPPLFSFQITNPVTYFKLWFKKVWANEGIVLHLRVKPLTIIIVALLFTGTSFGLTFGAAKYLAGFLPFEVFPSPSPTPIQSPIPTPNPWVETAYSGVLHKTEDKFYLVIPSGEAITLQIPSNINLTTLVGKRILASGSYNQLSKILMVNNASNMEILPTKLVPVPVSSITPSPAPSSIPMKQEQISTSSPTPISILQ